LYATIYILIFYNDGIETVSFPTIWYSPAPVTSPLLHTHSLTHSLLLTHSLIHSLSLTHSITHPFTLSLIHSLIYLLFHSLTHSLTHYKDQVFFLYFLRSLLKDILTEICYELNMRYTWTLCSLQEQTHTFESILSRSDGDNRDNQAQATGDNFLQSYLNSGVFYITPCSPLSACCTICSCCLDVRYRNIPTQVNITILLNRTVRCFFGPRLIQACYDVTAMRLVPVITPVSLVHCWLFRRCLTYLTNYHSLTFILLMWKIW
jgi:hypothetical protein